VAPDALHRLEVLPALLPPPPASEGDHAFSLPTVPSGP